MNPIARILFLTIGLLAFHAAAQTNDISGTVTSPKGPEAGVWVIAETTELPTRFARIVVTDDRGRYLIPDLPNMNYSVWVRGYGLVDSPKVRAAPGKTLNLTAVPAPNDAAAAHYYPAIYCTRCSVFRSRTTSAARAASRPTSRRRRGCRA
jgi:hypothetical protein